MSTETVLALLATIVLETAVAVLLLPEARRRLAVDVVLLNLFTHPLLTLIAPTDPLTLLALEGVVTAVEAVGYVGVTGLPWRQAVLLSLAANGLTTSIGLALWPLRP